MEKGTIILEGGQREGELQPPALNRAARRRGDTAANPRNTVHAEPIRWIQAGANCQATAFGPFRIDVTELPSMSAVDPPNYQMTIVAVDEKLPDVHDWNAAKGIAVRFLALAVKKALDSLVDAGVVGVRPAPK